MKNNQTTKANNRTTKRGVNQKRRRDEIGEGVISLAIGVLIMAFLGAGMWLAFNATMNKAQDSVDAQVTKIGG